MAQQRCSWCGELGHLSPACPRRGMGCSDYNDATVSVAVKSLPESDMNSPWPKQKNPADKFTPDDPPEPCDYGMTFNHD